MGLTLHTGAQGLEVLEPHKLVVSPCLLWLTLQATLCSNLSWASGTPFHLPTLRL